MGRSGRTVLHVIDENEYVLAEPKFPDSLIIQMWKYHYNQRLIIFIIVVQGTRETQGSIV